jgi:hypothetical protein
VALGAALIPLLTLPAGYYLGFLVAGALLAARRPWIAAGSLAAVLGCALAVAGWGNELPAFLGTSAIVVVYALWLLVACGKPVAGDPSGCAPRPERMS